MDVDWGAIESDCRRRWADSGLFEAEPDNGRPKRFITVAYPYPNSPQHIGHGRTYTIADVHARFRRLRGENVLFPMGFHYTGTPILGMAKRVAAGDKELMENLRVLYGVPEDEIAGFTDPINIARYFHQEIKSGMIEMGYSIDWRREFTTIDPAYSKFIEWQINTLREKGLIIRGSHPVGWCPEDQNPVSQHDTLGDVEPEFTEYVMIKFLIDGYIVPAATLRPETLFGVTNLWVDQNLTYVRVLVDGQKWIVSRECARKLEFLERTVSYEGEITGADLVGRAAIMPHTGGEIPILPAEFVQSSTGTGIVMSVPAHAPYDWQALRDLADSIDGRPGSAAASDIHPICIIETNTYGRVPAEDAIVAATAGQAEGEEGEVKGEGGCTGQNDPRLEDATKQLYAKEFYEGVMADDVATGKFAGLAVRQAKEDVRAWLADEGHAETLLEILDGPVRCRCGAECVVKILSDQWFLNYGDSRWKESAHRCLDDMSILPNEIRQEFNHVIDWLHERACARQHGLGTKLPWDQDWIVESLSDSVIYMAYYVIAKFVNDGTIRPEQMTREFFDYVLLGMWDDPDVKKWRETTTDIPQDVLRAVRDEFCYFYPVDYRHSGRDLVPNHLTFFILNHVAMFAERLHWPRGIVVNGSVLMDGSKMSKSMGNIIPLRQAIREYGADTIRLAIITSAELLQDADFNMESVHGMRAKLEALYGECIALRDTYGDGAGGDGTAGGGGEEPAETVLPAEDLWLLSKMRQTTLRVGESMERMRMREALHLILFEFESMIGWYTKRTAAKGSDGEGMRRRVAATRVTMLQPFAPHITESMLAALGCESDSEVGVVVGGGGWPDVADDSIDTSVLQAEDLLRDTMDDIASILKVTGIKPNRIMVYVAGPQKMTVYRGVLNCVLEEKRSMGDVMKGLLADPAMSGAKRMPDFVQKALRDILSYTLDTRNARSRSTKFDEAEFLASELPELASAEFGAAEVAVYTESDPEIYDPKGKARHARPFKPAILIE